MYKDILEENLLKEDKHFKDDLKTIERWISMFLDHLIFCVTVFLIFVIIFFVIESENEFMLTLLFAIYLNKDIINSRSIAKRLVGQIVVDSKTLKPASELKCLMRNFTMILWPIELLVVIFSPNKRIGDYLSGTKIVSNDKGKFSVIFQDLKQASFKKWMLAYLIAFIYSYCLFTFINQVLVY